MIKIRLVESYKVGDNITYDSNYRGIHPNICTGKIISISSGLATHSDPNPSKVYKVKTDKGYIVGIDEPQIIDILCTDEE